MKTIKYTLHILLIFIFLGSCSNDNDMPKFPTKYARILEASITVKTEAENKITIRAHFDSEETAKEKFMWSISDPELATVVTNEDNSATIQGLEPGSTTLKIESADGKLKYFSTLTVVKAYPFREPIFIDFGNIESNTPFNVFKTSDGKIENLIDKSNMPSGYSIKIDGSFATLDRNISNTLGFPSEVSNDMFFNDGINVESSSLVLSNLNKNLKYTLVFYSSINDNNTENEYIVKGSTEEVVHLITARNGSNYVTVKDMIPDEKEEIRITLKAGPNNTQWARFYCINAMIILPKDYKFEFPLSF